MAEAGLVVSLSKPSERQPNIVDTYTKVPVGVIEERLPQAKYVGGGSFCKVYMLECWDRRMVGGQCSPAFNTPVIIKLSSAGFKTGLSVAEQENEQANLEAHYNREKHAHLVLEGQSRVVRVFHTFKGRMLVPLNGGRVPMKVMGFVEELCSQYSLNHFLITLNAKPQYMPTHFSLDIVAAQMSALADQVREFDRIGVAHQDINLSNIFVDTSSGPVIFKFGDLNMMQWTALLCDGSYWGGTVGFMPRRVRLLYKGLQPYPAPGAGEAYHDVYALGKTLLHLLCFPEGDLEPPFAKADDDLEKEDASLKTAALELLELQRLEGGALPELASFGVWCGLAMCWDGTYTDQSDTMRLTPAAAAGIMSDWASICAMWSKDKQGFWADAGAVEAMAQLYLKLAHHSRVPALGSPRIPSVHLQQDEHILEAAERFFRVGGGHNMAAVREKAEQLLPAWSYDGPVLQQRTQQQQEAAPASQQQSAGPAAAAKENAVRRRGAGAKRKQDAENQALQSTAERPRKAAKPAAQQLGKSIVLSAKLKAAEVYAKGKKPNGAPMLLGSGNSTALALAQAIQALLQGAAGTVQLNPGRGAQPLAFTVTKTGRVSLSRSSFEALAACPAGCSAWNESIKTLSTSYQKQRDDIKGRVLLLTRELGAVVS